MTARKKLCGTCRHWAERSDPYQPSKRIDVGDCTYHPPCLPTSMAVLPRAAMYRDWGDGCPCWKTQR